MNKSVQKRRFWVRCMSATDLYFETNPKIERHADDVHHTLNSLNSFSGSMRLFGVTRMNFAYLNNFFELRNYDTMKFFVFIAKYSWRLQYSAHFFSLFIIPGLWQNDIFAQFVWLFFDQRFAYEASEICQIQWAVIWFVILLFLYKYKYCNLLFRIIHFNRLILRLFK